MTIFVSTKKPSRIVSNYKFKYVDIRGQKKIHSQKKTVKIQIQVIENNEIIYYTADPYPLCMYSKSPCTSFKNIKVNRKINKFKYKVFYPKSQIN